MIEMDDWPSWTSHPMPKEGETVFVTGPTWIKRRWWQFWRPKWAKGPITTQRYIAGPTITASYPPA